MKNDKICVYAICKNESKFVDKWLDSMSEADYIVVLDTGSTDDTVAKLKADKRVTKVRQKKITPWRFDVARNASMELIPKDATILVCTDFDEVFNPGWAARLKEIWTPTTTRVYYTYAWSHNDIGEPTDIFMYDKIHTRDYKWIFPVHEVLNRVKDDFEEHSINAGESIYLHHYQDNSKARGSYFDLLKVSVDENPEDSHVRMLYAREFLLRGEYQSALDEYLAVLKMPDVNNANKRLVLLESLGRVASIYSSLKNYDEALWYAQEFIKEDYTYREPYLIMAEIYNNMKMYTLAESCVNAGLKYATRKYNWVERADTWTGLPNDILSISKYYLGDVNEAIQECNKAMAHAPDDLRLLKNLNAFLNKKIELTEKNHKQ